MVDGLYKAITAARRESHVFEEHLLLLVGFKLCNVGFCLSADNQHLGILALDGFLYGFGIVVSCGCAGIVNVANIQHRFRSQQEETLGGSILVFCLEGYGTGTLALFQCVAIGFQYL